MAVGACLKNVTGAIGAASTAIHYTDISVVRPNLDESKRGKFR